MTAEYPDTMQEFIDRFSTEKECRQYIEEVRWGTGFVCPRCGHTEGWRVRRGSVKCKKCRRDISAIAGTVFGETRLPTRIWFQAIWCIVSQKSGVSALGLAHSLGLSRPMTSWYLLKRIRSAMVRIGRENLSGTVEVDEVFLGGVKPGIRGRGAAGKVLLLVAVEDKGARGIGRIRIEVIPDASAIELRKGVMKMVELGSTVRTDGWAGYTTEALKGYKHVVMEKHSHEPGEDPTPLVHRIASLLKRWLLGTHQGGVRPAHVKSYLDEFVFRFNRRTSKSRGKLFYRLVQGMVDEKRAGGVKR